MIDFTKSKQYFYPSVLVRMDFFLSTIRFTTIHSRYSKRGRHLSLSLTANLKKRFPRIGLFKLLLQTVNIMMANKRFTMIPLELFEEEQAELLFLSQSSETGRTKQ